jgi:hypothetical protein
LREEKEKFDRRESLLDLFRQFPRFRPLHSGAEPLVPASELEKYPTFANDFRILDEVLVPVYATLNEEAVTQQNLYRWMYIFLILGGALATILGIIRLAFDVEVIGLAGAIVAATLGCISLALRSLPYHKRYLNARLAAEQLRGEYFLFLGRIGPYADESQRLAHLKQRVLRIKHEGERNESV